MLEHIAIVGVKRKQRRKNKRKNMCRRISFYMKNNKICCIYFKLVREKCWKVSRMSSERPKSRLSLILIFFLSFSSFFSLIISYSYILILRIVRSTYLIVIHVSQPRIEINYLQGLLFTD